MIYLVAHYTVTDYEQVGATELLLVSGAGMVRFRQEPIVKNYADGKKAVRFLEDGSGMVFYKSGRIAITVTSTDLGFIQQAFADNRHGSVLLNFDELGCATAPRHTPRPCDHQAAVARVVCIAVMLIGARVVAQGGLGIIPSTEGRHHRPSSLCV